MRKVQLLFICLMLSVAAFAADKVVKLPKPNLNRTGTVMKALSERQSTREYASKALTLVIYRTYYGRQRNQSFGCWKTNGSFRFE